MSNIEAYIYNGLIERGMPAHVSAGFVMNMKDESGLVADIVEGVPNVHGTRGKGIYQLTDDRRDSYEAKYGNDWSYDTQMDNLVWETQNTEKSAYAKALNTNTAGEAGASIVRNFLRPAKEHADRRAAKYLGESYVPPVGRGSSDYNAQHHTGDGVPEMEEDLGVGVRMVEGVLDKIVPKVKSRSKAPSLVGQQVSATPPPLRRSQRKPPVVLVPKKEKKA